MKNLFTFAVLLALPLAGMAQSGPGTYILVDNRQTVYTGNLEIFDRGLTSKEGKGKRKVWEANEVYWARVGTRHYMPVTGFEVLGALRPRIVNYGLAELLDSGRVSLLRYDQQVNVNSVGSSGSYSNMSNTVSTYLLQSATEENAVTIPMNRLSGKGPEFQAMLNPYFSSRPDLQAQLAKGEVRRRNLAAFFHAFNTGQPFVAKPEDDEKE